MQTAQGNVRMLAEFVYAYSAFDAAKSEQPKF